MLLWLCAACDVALGGSFVIADARLPGGEPIAIEIREGKIAAMGDVSADLPRYDARGATVVPALIDSHVHLSYLDAGRAHADGGIVAAVDLAAPIERIGIRSRADPRLIWSGPMITAIGGYPTRSWGEAGYGLQVADEALASDAVARLQGAGARLIKVPVEDGGLSDEILARVVSEAHARGMLVVAHALSDRDAARAAEAGVDGLAHTPTERLSPATVARWAGPDRFVISTLRAFGSLAAPANLRDLRAAGAVVLYGTDLGNTQSPGIDATEIALLVQAGLDGAAILKASTADPAARFGWKDLGQIRVGSEASLLLLDKDPLADPLTLAEPQAVFIAGERR